MSEPRDKTHHAFDVAWKNFLDCIVEQQAQQEASTSEEIEARWQRVQERLREDDND